MNDDWPTLVAGHLLQAVTLWRFANRHSKFIDS